MFPTARVHNDGGRPTIVVDIPPQLWEGNEGIDHPNNQRHFAGTLVVNGVPMHLQAIQVTDGDGTQDANAAEYAEDLNSLYQLNGASGPFVTSDQVEPGQQFVIYAVPYED